MKASLLHKTHVIISPRVQINHYTEPLVKNLVKIFLKINMLQKLKNLFKLLQILKKRGNWPLIRKSKKQLWNFFICRNGLIQKPFFSAMIYWFHMLKGLDILVWRLETFGFLFSQRFNDNDRKYINQYLK